MEAHINQDELRLLTYMHEHAPGFGERYKINPKNVCEGLGIDVDALGRSASFLEEHGLVGMVTYDIGRRDNPDDFVLRAIYLTGLGETYMRDLERQSGIGTRLTLAVLSRLEKVAIDAGSKILAEIIVARMRAG